MTAAAPSSTSGLNAAQREAVLTVDRPVLVLAGPGTGKTKMLTAKFAHLVLERKIPAERILITTFTRKATQELEDRITRVLQAGGHYSKVKVQNFHSLALDILSKHAPELYGRKPCCEPDMVCS
jgi:superfamily I DNA/RNA helicase